MPGMYGSGPGLEARWQPAMIVHFSGRTLQAFRKAAKQ
jgi:hypothetical protein